MENLLRRHSLVLGISTKWQVVEQSLKFKGSCILLEGHKDLLHLPIFYKALRRQLGIRGGPTLDRAF